MEAAVAGTAVPVAARDGERTDEQTVRLMRTSVDSRLAEGVAVAKAGLGGEVIHRDGRPGTARAAGRNPDALDDLIAGAPEDADDDADEQ